ncbi:hypothetical protein PRZ48_014289 [Zasmidium cellare]|uniref:F-box domain-containing protein n=1 Tax=Zasmidium cellare TaxID=395010 RepID=A0ABR0E132_ZASCE|nr:hypothetical protein PRZ48_014289 [Zasmidium cellare]
MKRKAETTYSLPQHLEPCPAILQLTLLMERLSITPISSRKIANPRTRHKHGQTHDSQPTKRHILSLPQEVRDIIYSFVFSEAVDLKPHTHQTATSRGAALLLTCKQVYQEGLKPYYQSATFTYRPGFRLLKWIVNLPSPARASLREVRIICNEYSQYTVWDFKKLWRILCTFRSSRELGEGVFKAGFRDGKGGLVWYSTKRPSKRRGV